jgi:hypothetical protein
MAVAAAVRDDVAVARATSAEWGWRGRPSSEMCGREGEKRCDAAGWAHGNWFCTRKEGGRPRFPRDSLILRVGRPRQRKRVAEGGWWGGLRGESFARLLEWCAVDCFLFFSDGKWFEWAVGVALNISIRPSASINENNIIEQNVSYIRVSKILKTLRTPNKLNMTTLAQCGPPSWQPSCGTTSMWGGSVVGSAIGQ